MKGDMRVPPEEICLLRRTELSREQWNFLGYMTYCLSCCLVEVGPVSSFWVNFMIKSANIHEVVRGGAVRPGVTPHVHLLTFTGFARQRDGCRKRSVPAFSTCRQHSDGCKKMQVFYGTYTAWSRCRTQHSKILKRLVNRDRRTKVLAHV